MKTEANKTLNDERDSNGIRVGAWEAGLCGCCSSIVPNCLMVTCLPCVSVAQIVSRLGMYKFSHALLGFLLLYSTFFASFSLSTLLVSDSIDTLVNEDEKNHDVAVTQLGVAGAVAQVSRIASVVLFLVYLVLVFHLRATIRQRFQLPGNFIFDFATSVWCSCCSIAQMATHVKSYTPGSCSFGPVDTLPAYQ